MKIESKPGGDKTLPGPAKPEIKKMKMDQGQLTTVVPSAFSLETKSHEES